jgi:ribosome-binding protein aMBF1 (putative translation factor)
MSSLARNTTAIRSFPSLPSDPLEATRFPSPAERHMMQRGSTYICDRFGVRLRELRLSRNLCQVEMAIGFGIDRSFISDVERGRKSIGLPMLEVIAIGFGITLAELLRDL